MSNATNSPSGMRMEKETVGPGSPQPATPALWEQADVLPLSSLPRPLLLILSLPFSN